MKSKPRSLLAIASCTLFYSNTALSQTPQPQGWMWGGGIAASQDVYTDFDNRVVPIPLIGYAGERLRVFGPFVSYQVVSHGNVTVDTQLVPVFAGYDEDDSAVFEGMKGRDFSYAAGVSLNINKQGWFYSLSANADILNTFGGYQASASIGKQFFAGGYIIEPSVSVNYQDSNYVDYYYGVRPEEATSTRAAYQAGSALNTQISVSISTMQFLGGMTRVQVGATYYDDSISDSPITDDDMALSAMLMFSRPF